MKSITFALAICLFLALTEPSMAADISGNWVAPNDGVDVEFEFKVDGENLKGKVYNPLFGKSDIKDGKINGNNFSFYIIHPTNNIEREQRVVFRGTAMGAIIRITFRSAVQGLKEVVAIRKPPEK
jgi:hypothetical protein